MPHLVWVRSCSDYGLTFEPPAWDHFSLGHSELVSEQMRAIAHNSGIIKSDLLTAAGGKMELQSPIYFAVGWQKMPPGWGLGTAASGIKGPLSNCDAHVIIGRRHFVRVSSRHLNIITQQHKAIWLLATDPQWQNIWGRCDGLLWGSAELLYLLLSLCVCCRHHLIILIRAWLQKPRVTSRL